MDPLFSPSCFSGRCYLEWEGKGKPDKPVLKDKYASERRMAKVLNFSIAYGKTSHGLSKDFDTTIKEAEATVKRCVSCRISPAAVIANGLPIVA